MMVRPASTRVRHGLLHRRDPVTVTIPARYRTVHSRVLVTPAKSWTTTVPAWTVTRSHRVKVEPARRWKVCTPATYKMVERKVRVSHDYTRRVEVACGS